MTRYRIVVLCMRLQVRTRSPQTQLDRAVFLSMKWKVEKFHVFFLRADLLLSAHKIRFIMSGVKRSRRSRGSFYYHCKEENKRRRREERRQNCFQGARTHSLCGDSDEAIKVQFQSIKHENELFGIRNYASSPLSLRIFLFCRERDKSGMSPQIPQFVGVYLQFTE